MTAETCSDIETIKTIKHAPRFVWAGGVRDRIPFISPAFLGVTRAEYLLKDCAACYRDRVSRGPRAMT